jgi:ribosomal protein S1
LPPWGAAEMPPWDNNVFGILLVIISEFTGEISHNREFGCYIYTKELNTEKLPFIHSSQIFEANSTKTFSDLSEGEFIKFRIIGVNQETYRLNASALEQFKI